MLIYKLLFLFTLTTANANPLKAEQSQPPLIAADSEKPLTILDHVFELKTNAQNDSNARKYYVLKEVAKSELAKSTTEEGSIPSEVFVVPSVENFSYYQAAKSLENTAAEVGPASDDKSKVILAHVQGLLKELKKDVKAVDHQSVENLKEILDSYKSAAIEQGAIRSADCENNHADDLVPPPEGLNEKNYYLDKTVRKTKKYDAVVDAIKASLLDADWDHAKKVDDEYEDDDESEGEETEISPVKAKLTLLPPEETVTSKRIEHKEFISAVKPSDYVNYEGFQFYQPEFKPLPTPKVDVKKITYSSLTKAQPQIYKNHKESLLLLNKGESYPAAAKPQTADRKTGDDYEDSVEDDNSDEYADDEEENDDKEEVQETPPMSAKSDVVNLNLPFGLSGDTGTRIEFQMHGTNGPKSYKFGYDTGKGKNRQFRLEERDNEGNVRGHYGYMDRQGQMKIVKYVATRDGGFQVEN